MHRCVYSIMVAACERYFKMKVALAYTLASASRKAPTDENVNMYLRKHQLPFINQYSS